MQKEFQLVVDIEKKILTPSFEVNTLDLKSVKLQITITKGMTLVDLTGVTVRMSIRKPDNNVIFQECQIINAKGGQVEITLENQAYLLPGSYSAEIMCFKGSDVVAVTGSFSYKSVRGIMTDEAVESKSEFTAITKTIDEVNKTVTDLREKGTGIDAEARQDIESVTTQLTETSNQLNSSQINVLFPPAPLVAAKGDGVADDTNAIKSIMSYLQDKGGGVIYFPKPPQKYIAFNVAVPSNVTIQGASWDVVIEQKNTNVATDCLFNIIGGTGGITQNKKNIVFRDIHLKGTVDTDAFSQYNHLVKIQGGSNVMFERTKFIGFRGDAIVITFGGLSATYRNMNIAVKDCVFDGVNKDNRNAISVTDVDGLLVHNCQFENMTRHDMPGAIDVEPNGSDYATVIKNITVRDCSFKNIGGNVGAIAMYIPIASGNFTNQNPKNFTFDNNKMDNVFRGFHITQLQNSDITDKVEGLNINVVNNTVKNATDRAFWTYGVKDITFKDNLFEDCANASRIGWSAANRKSVGVKLSKNTHRRCGTTDGQAVAVYSCERLEFVGDTFEDCGVLGGNYGVGIYFSAGTTSKVKIIQNTFMKPNGKMTAAIAKAEAAVTLPTTNVFKENNLGGLAFVFGYDFSADLTDTGYSSTTFDTSTLPDTFLRGTTTLKVVGGIGLPSGYTDGMLITNKPSDNVVDREFILQTFYPKNTGGASLTDTFYRKGNDSANSWSLWYKNVGVLI